MAKLGDVLTIEDLSAYLKISKSTLYKLVREGALPCQKIGRHWRFHKDAIDGWLKAGQAKKREKVVVVSPCTSTMSGASFSMTPLRLARALAVISKSGGAGP
ncbi:MAG: helix-turn-helix domain-containing protein [Deltaproteobacteria bacterium]|nr:helix-turn-helix domain-containing protein [Deltaproteobacteria bacterium]